MAQKSLPSAGIFTLPTEFNSKDYAAQWAPKGNGVDAMKAPQPIIGTNYGACGWSVWQYPKEHRLGNRPAEVVTKSGPYILMFRPKSVQDDVNAIYGNLSKTHLIREQSGESIAGQTVTDHGILSDERIKKGTGITEFGGETLSVPMNPVSNAPRREASPVATAMTDS